MIVYVVTCEEENYGGPLVAVTTTLDAAKTAAAAAKYGPGATGWEELPASDAHADEGVARRYWRSIGPWPDYLHIIEVEVRRR